MKTNFILFFLLLTGYVSQAQTRYFFANLQGSQQVPSVATSASGVVVVSYNITTNSLKLYGDYKGLTTPVMAGHIHGPAAAGANAPVLITLQNSGGNDGTLSSTAVLSDANETDLLNGLLYVNVHNETYPSGEIRGQLTATTEGTSYFLNGRLQGAQEVAPNGSTASGSFSLLLDATANKVYLTGSFTGLSAAATMGHIHEAPPHANGSVIVPIIFSAATSGVIHLAGDYPAANVNALLDGNAYVNIHNTVFVGGEVRGQITRLSQFSFFKATLQGIQEVPGNASTATGVAIVKYNNETNVFDLMGNYQGIAANISASHVHSPALAGSNANVLFGLTNTGGTSGVLTGTTTLTPEQETDLFDAKMYVNVHNSVFPQGEIRGQLFGTSAGETQYLTGKMQGTQEVESNASTGSGSVVVLLDKLTNEVYVTGNFTGLSANASAAHIHRGQAKVNGSVVIGLAVTNATSGTVSGSAIVSQGFADSILNGFSYFNIHNSVFPGGELRAQLGNQVLPLRLTYFNGYKDRNNVVLVWESSLEVDLKQYEIEQQDPVTKMWLRKSVVFASGLNTGSKYRSVDLPFATNNPFVLYRLKMTDRNGSFTYSNAVKINIRKASATLNVLANPVVKGVLRYNITGLADNAKAEVSIIDFNGRLLHKSVQSTLSTNQIDVSTLAPGMYKLIIKVGESLLQESFMK